MFYVYVLRSLKDSSIYVGYTTDLKSRFATHNNGGSKATRNKIPWELVYYESYKDQSFALRRERRLKSYGRALRQLRDRIGL